MFLPEITKALTSFFEEDVGDWQYDVETSTFGTMKVEPKDYTDIMLALSKQGDIGAIREYCSVMNITYQGLDMFKIMAVMSSTI